jgi:hypothetical protein
LAGVLQATIVNAHNRQTPPSVDQVAGRLQNLSPGLSREESLRQANLRYITGGMSGSCHFGDVFPEHQRHDP